MGRSPCCDKLGLKKGPWTPEEDKKLLAFIEEHGHGNWRALPSKAGLQRCGKSCRLRWTNYLRPDIKRGKFSLQEEQTIIQLHALLGNRWSAIATHLPKRTDNEIKNYWNTHLKKRLAKMGIDPVTHKPKNDALHSATDGGQQSKNAANLSHMAQWESARLEAEARLVRQSKLRSSSSNNTSFIAHSPDLQVNDHHQIVPSVSLGPLSSSSSTSAHHYLTMTSVGVSGSSVDTTNTTTAPRCLEVLKTWHGGGGGGGWPSTSSTSANNDGFIGIGMGSTGIDGSSGGGLGVGMESPTSTLSFSENNNGPPMVPNMGPTSVIEFMGHHDGDDHHQDMIIKKEGDHHSHQEWSSLSFIPSSTGFHDINDENDKDDDDGDDDDDDVGETFMEGFTELLLSTTNNTAATKNDMCNERSEQEENTHSSSGSRGTDITTTGTRISSKRGSDCYEDNKTYWNSILNLVNSSASHSPMF